tara:strand:+ start:1548 stop:3869 length:2322 start_codon:yes stop_codon:yes gene_type:complete
MLDWLIKHPATIFQNGDISFKIQLPGLIILIILIALTATAMWSYRITVNQTDGKTRGFLICLRSSILMLTAIALLQPFMMVYHTDPDASYLAILADSSKSMQVVDMLDGQSRIEVTNQLLFDPNHGILEKLNQKFKTRLFTFDNQLKRINSTEITSTEGEATHFPNAINQVIDDLKGVPLSGIVIFSDGADKSGVDISKLALQMRDRKLPIHAVGIGNPENFRDLEISRVDAPRVAEEDFPIDIWVTVTRKGYQEKKTTIRLLDKNRVIKSQVINLDKTHPTLRIPIKFIPRNPGTQKFIVEILTEKDEAIPQNNAKKFLIKVSPSKRGKILFVDGHPRQEFAFIKRALEKDPNIRVIDRYLTDNNHFGGTQQGEKNFGLYPNTKEDLFNYDGIIFGSIEASQFTKDQLENTAKFVQIRGGGFLMLGGSNSLGNAEVESSYINTPIAQILPVELQLGTPAINSANQKRQRSPKQSSPLGYQVKLTAEGKIDSLLTLSNTPKDNLNKWNSLPNLLGYSQVIRAKPGAVVLAVHPWDQNEFGNRILLATHNYNAGRVMVFTPHSSWRWKMLSPKDDDRHQRFWRQIAKWLITQPKAQLTLDIAKTSYFPKEPVILKASALDQNFEPTDKAKIRAVITDESGKKNEVKLDPVLGDLGSYTARFLPHKRSNYKVNLIGNLAGKNLRNQDGLFEVAASDAEYSDAELNEQSLKNIARLSGGRYYTINQINEMVEQIPLVESSTSKIIEEDLWDIPLVFVIITLLFSIEWLWRKRVGLV